MCPIKKVTRIVLVNGQEFIHSGTSDGAGFYRNLESAKAEHKATIENARNGPKRPKITAREMRERRKDE